MTDDKQIKNLVVGNHSRFFYLWVILDIKTYTNLKNEFAESFLFKMVLEDAPEVQETLARKKFN